MAFPSGTRTTGVTGGGVNVTDQVVDVPETGDGSLVVVLLGLDSNGSRTGTPPVNWTELVDDDGGAAGNFLLGGYRIFATGQAAHQVTFVTSGIERGAYHVIHYPAGSWHGTSPPEASAVATATSTAPDSPSLTPSWGAADTQWLTFIVREGNAAAPSYPTNYGNGANTPEGSGGGATISSAWRDLNAASENPGAFTSASLEWVAVTVAVRGAGLSAVGKSLQTSWHVRAAIGKSLETTWHVRAAVAKTLETSWNVLAAVAKSLQTSWHVLSDLTVVGKSLETSWHVLSSVGKSLETSWNVRAAIGRALETSWHVFTAVGKSLETTWHLRAVVWKELLTRWTVFGPDPWNVRVNGVVRKADARPLSMLKIDDDVGEGLGNLQMRFIVNDDSWAPEIEDEIKIDHFGQELGPWVIRTLEVNDEIPGTWIYDVGGQAPTTYLYDDVVPVVTRTTPESDKQRIAWLVNTYGTHGITAGAEVQTLLPSMPATTDDGRPEQTFGPTHLAAAIDSVLDVSGGRRYVDDLRKLHTFVTETFTAPFGLSATPNGVTTYRFDDFTLRDDALEDGYHSVLVSNGDDINVTRTIASPPPLGQRRHTVIESDEITSVTQAQQIGDVFLAQHSAPARSGRAVCYQPGLRAGMRVAITHPKHGLNGEFFQINRVSPSMQSPEVIRYAIDFGTPRLSRDQIVRKITRQRRWTKQDIKVAGTNRVKNAAFTDGYDFWSASARWGADSFVTAEALFGTRVARATATNQTIGDLVPDEFYKVSRNNKEGWQIGMHTWVRSRSAGSLRVEVREYNNAGSLLASTVIAEISAAESDWTPHVGWFGPSEARGGRLAFHANTTQVKVAAYSPASATMEAWVGGAEVEQGNTPTEFAPRPKELDKDQVEEKHIKNDSVSDAKVKTGLSGSKLSTNSIPGDRHSNKSIPQNKLANLSVGEPELQEEAVTQVKILAGAVFKPKHEVTINMPSPGPGATVTGQAGASGYNGTPTHDAYVQAGSERTRVPWVEWEPATGQVHHSWRVAVTGSSSITVRGTIKRFVQAGANGHLTLKVHTFDKAV